MTTEEARKEIPDIESFCRQSCTLCTSNDWYCPTYCDMLQKARRMDFERIVEAYARNDEDMAKVYRYIKQAKIVNVKGEHNA
ncbi:MAG: hypothetical protein NC452_05950 [Eubacterium sp.]|nr:hypothetical protein [Eubacterium sp.]